MRLSGINNVTYNAYAVSMNSGRPAYSGYKFGGIRLTLKMICDLHEKKLYHFLNQLRPFITIFLLIL